MFTISITKYENQLFTLDIQVPSGRIDHEEYDESQFKGYIKAVKDYCKKGYKFQVNNVSGCENLPKWILKLI